MTRELPKGNERKLSVLMPLHNDWESAFVLIGNLDRALRGVVKQCRFLVVDDFSRAKAPEELPVGLDGATIDVLRLRRNLGHQRAIAVGLTYLHEEADADLVMVLDSDGEDTCEGALDLMKRFDELGGRVLVFAQRARRSEGLLFKIFYSFYRAVFWMLTGQSTREGNFSVIPANHLDTLVAVSELWNHYAASVRKAKLPLDSVPIDRGHRIAGQSKMNLVSLIAHGMGAIAVFSEIAALRLFLATVSLLMAAMGAIGLVVGIRLLTDLAIPGWATNAVGMLLIVVLQASLLMLVFAFIVIHGRKGSSFIPLRDCGYFVGSTVRLRARSSDGRD